MEGGGDGYERVGSLWFFGGYEIDVLTGGRAWYEVCTGDRATEEEIE